MDETYLRNLGFDHLLVIFDEKNFGRERNESGYMCKKIVYFTICVRAFVNLWKNIDTERRLQERHTGDSRSNLCHTSNKMRPFT